MVVLADKIYEADCEYLENERLPALVLATGLYKYDFVEGREWLHIAHQTAGVGCHQHYMVGTILQPRPEVIIPIKAIIDNWFDTSYGALGVTLDNIMAYRKQLNELLGVDCNSSYEHFEEGIYPIDCSPQVIRKLAVDEMHDNLDDFIKFRSGLHKLCDSFCRWNLFILGENSD